MDDLYTVDTPENIEFSYDVAGIGSRFLAALIDSFIIILVQIILGIVLVVLYQATDDGTARSILLAVGSILSFLFLWGYYLLFELISNGQSPGKRAIGLRVVRVGGRPITFVASAIRNLVRLVDFLPGFYGIGVVVMFADGRSRRLGDLAAGTLVVKEQQVVTLASLTTPVHSASLPPVGPSEQLPAPSLANVHLLTGQDFALVEEFLQRRASLGGESRARLGAQIAQGIRTRLGIADTGAVEPFLEYVAREYRLYLAAKAIR